MNPLYEQLLENARYVGEKHKAVYIPSNPKEMSEQWQMVFDENEENCLLKIIHEVIPVSQCDKTIELLSQSYGEVEILGETYEAEPYSIGIKRAGTKAQEIAECFVKNIYQRENWLIKLEDELQNDSFTFELLSTQLRSMPDDIYARTTQPLIDRKINELLTETSEEEARQAAGIFYMNYQDEITRRNESFNMQRQMDNLVRKMKFE